MISGPMLPLASALLAIVGALAISPAGAQPGWSLDVAPAIHAIEDEVLRLSATTSLDVEVAYVLRPDLTIRTGTSQAISFAPNSQATPEATGSLAGA